MVSPRPVSCSQRRRAHPRVGGHPAGRLARAPARERDFVDQVGGGDAFGRPSGGPGVAQISPVRQNLQPGGAVQQSRVQMRQAVVSCQTRGDRALARGGRAVDGDDKVQLMILNE